MSSRKRPNYYLSQFAAQKVADSFLQGNILMMGADNGRNAVFLYETIMVPWGHKKYKIYVYDNFSEKFGPQRREMFLDQTRYFQDQIVLCNSSQFDIISKPSYILAIFSGFYTAPQAYTYAIDLWDNIVPDGYYFFLNYQEGETLYSLDFNSHPKAGIDRFLQAEISQSSEVGFQPYPYIRKS